MSRWKPDIFQYLDPRAYLRDYYEAAKTHQRGFSHRYFARRAGFASSNFVKLFMDGKRNLSHESADKIAEALDLTPDEHRFWTHLVGLAQAEDAQQRATHMEVLATTRRFWDARPLDGMLFEYLSRWHHVAVRELAARPDFQEDPRWIAANLLPSITAAQAQESLSLLLGLGLLIRDEQGRVQRGEPTLDAGHEVQAVGVRGFHRQMIERAQAAMDTVKPRARDISAMTVCVRADQVAELKRRLREFREQLMTFCDEQQDPDVVYQINLQLFPLSTERGKQP